MIEQTRFKAVIFDLDGTLLDTLSDLTNACNQAITEVGCRALTEAKMKDFIGYGARELVIGAVRESFPEWTAAQIEPIFLNYRRIYKANWDIKTTLYPGIADLLAELKAHDIKLAVLSNKPHDSTDTMVKHYFPEGYFDSCYGQLDPWPTKPDPALALEIARELGVTPTQMALVGDSGSDMLTALRAGMTAIGVTWGFRDEADLRTAGEILLANDTANLRELLFAREI
ncbi:MAG: HAD family hydrolase [Eubacteriales bacterium]|nr:HAD family hydrolase [Eubacteriales bacterium]